MCELGTYKLLLLVGHQLGHLVLARRQLLFVVDKVTHDELALTGVQLELLGDLFEERHIEEAIVGVLLDELRRARHNHVRYFLIIGQPVVGQSSAEREREREGRDEYDIITVIDGHVCVTKGVTYFGTITSSVVKYSESSMKCSFLTKSARLRVSRLPLFTERKRMRESRPLIN